MGHSIRKHSPSMKVFSSLFLLATVHGSPLADPRDADHYFDTRELWARRRALFSPVNLPTALKLQADEVLDQTLNEIESTFDEVEEENIDSVNEEVKEAPITSAATAVEYQGDDLINLDVIKISNEEQEPLPLDKQDIRVSDVTPSLEYYYQYIERSYVDL